MRRWWRRTKALRSRDRSMSVEAKVWDSESKVILVIPPLAAGAVAVAAVGVVGIVVVAVEGSESQKEDREHAAEEKGWKE